MIKKIYIPLLALLIAAGTPHQSKAGNIGTALVITGSSAIIASTYFAFRSELTWSQKFVSLMKSGILFGTGTTAIILSEFL